MKSQRRSPLTILLLFVLAFSLFQSAAFSEDSYSVLRSGSRGQKVLRLQERLSELGYYTGKLDGDFGSGTRSAVRAFQRRNGLEEDGIAGIHTQEALFSAEAVPVPDHVEPTDVLSGALPLLVNQDHPVDEYFVPADLILMTDVCDPKLVKIKYADTQVVRTAAEAMIRMLEAAREDGITKWQVSAAYRSYEKQVRTLNAKISYYLRKNSGWSRARARRAALRTVAEPGSSEHHLGLAIDINVPGVSSFAGTKQCAWLHAHCWEYGFIIRYPRGKESITGFDAEAWHIRYVGVSHAKAMQEHDLCLEEYLQGIENGTINPPSALPEEDIILDD